MAKKPNAQKAQKAQKAQNAAIKAQNAAFKLMRGKLPKRTPLTAGHKKMLASLRKGTTKAVFRDGIITIAKVVKKGGGGGGQ